MNQWDILLDRINQNKLKADYVDKLNKEDEKILGRPNVD